MPCRACRCIYLAQSGDPAANTDGGDQYTGLDRFGRVIDQNWVKTSIGTSAARYQYGYDQDSQVLDRNDLVETALSELYHANSSASGDNATAYDALGRLTGFARGTLSASGHNGASLDTIASPSATQSWNLDAVGNQTGVTTNGTTVNQTFNTLNQPASTASGFSTNYDADGNTLVSGHFSLTYDAWNRLVSVRSSLSGAVAASYSYDSLGNRITETDAAGTTTDLYYNADGQVIEERLGSQALGNVHYQYVYGSTGNLILRDTYAGGSIVPSARLYALTDANGDITALTDPSGTVVERYEYSPYGAVTVLDASGTPRTGNVSAYGWQYLFQGGRLDGTTGLYRFGARDYDPSNGVWMQRDPIGLAAGQQDLYGFVGNSPTNAADPSGLKKMVAELPAEPISPTGGGANDSSAQQWFNSYEWASAAFEVLSNPIGALAANPELTAQSLSNIGSGIGKSAHDVVVAPYDLIRTSFDAFIYDTGHQASSYSGASTLEALQNGVSTEEIIANNYLNAQTLGVYGFAQSVKECLETGDPTAMQESAGGLVLNAVAAKGGEYVVSKFPVVQNTPKCPTNSNAAGCFPAETQVATREGCKPIESLVPGDQVWAYDFALADWRLCAVMKTFRIHHAGLMATIRFGDDSIEATYEHPFWVVRGENLEDRPRGGHLVREDGGEATPGRWVDAGDLRIGDELLRLNGRIETVEEVSLQSVDGIVYNFAVDQLRCYAVGRSGVLVHNDNGAAVNAPKGGRGANKLQPDPIAEGPHTVFKRDPQTGKITGYETYTPQTNPRNPNSFESEIRVDLQGKPHFNKATGQDVPTPHVHDPKTPGGVRPAMPGELPGS